MLFFFFFFNDTATTEIYTLSLHDALPIFLGRLLHPLRIFTTAFVQRLAAHLLGEPQRLVPRRIESPRRRVFLAQHLHHILERHRHVALHVVVGKVPPCILEDHLERPTPALALG